MACLEIQVSVAGKVATQHPIPPDQKRLFTKSLYDVISPASISGQPTVLYCTVLADVVR